MLLSVCLACSSRYCCCFAVCTAHPCFLFLLIFCWLTFLPLALPSRRSNNHSLRASSGVFSRWILFLPGFGSFFALVHNMLTVFTVGRIVWLFLLFFCSVGYCGYCCLDCCLVAGVTGFLLLAHCVYQVYLLPQLPAFRLFRLLGFLSQSVLLCHCPSFSIVGSPFFCTDWYWFPFVPALAT